MSKAKGPQIERVGDQWTVNKSHFPTFNLAQQEAFRLSVKSGKSVSVVRTISYLVTAATQKGL